MTLRATQWTPLCFGAGLLLGSACDLPGEEESTAATATDSATSTSTGTTTTSTTSGEASSSGATSSTTSGGVTDSSSTTSGDGSSTGEGTSTGEDPSTSTSEGSSTDEGSSSGGPDPVCGDPAAADMCMPPVDPAEMCLGVCDFVAEWSVTLGCETSTAADLAVDSTGALVVVATIGNDVLVRKYAPDGSLEWSLRTDEPFGLEAAAVALGPDDSIAVGATFNGGAAGMNAWVRKLDPDGCELWTRTYDAPPLITGESIHDRVSSLAVDDAGRVVLAASHNCVGCSLIAGTLVAYDDAGTELWVDTSTGILPWDLVAHPDGGVVVVGYGPAGFGLGVPGSAYAIRLSGDGIQQWTDVFNPGGISPDSNIAHAAALDPTGSLLVGGWLGENGPLAGYVQRTALDGALVNRWQFDDLPLDNRPVRGVAPGPVDSIWIAGGGYGHFWSPTFDPMVWLRRVDPAGWTLSTITLELGVDQHLEGLAADPVDDALYVLTTRGEGAGARAWVRRYAVAP